LPTEERRAIIQAMKVGSKDFYREMRLVLAPRMKGEGFSSLEGGRLGWKRPCGSGWLSLWFQCDTWGWDALWGSTFTVEFQVTDDPPTR